MTSAAGEAAPGGGDVPVDVDGQTAAPSRRGGLAGVWHVISGAIGAVMGLVPHVLHHVGLIAGAALVTGVGGNLLFAALGVVFSIPLLRRLYRRFHTWRAPAIALAVFAVMFSLSAFVIGPALTGNSTPDIPTPTQTPPSPEHGEHHGG